MYGAKENAEVWRAVPDFEGKYEVSNLGRIRSLDRIVTMKNGAKRFHEGKLLTPKKQKNGYLFYQLFDGNGKFKHWMLHRLVATVFIDNPQGYKEVNHKDGDKTNNKYTNLEWCTRQYNCIHAIENGLKDMSKVYSMHPVVQIKDGEIINEYPSIVEAANSVGVTPSAISRCLRGKSKKSMGYQWRYAE